MAKLTRKNTIQFSTEVGEYNHEEGTLLEIVKDGENLIDLQNELEQFDGKLIKITVKEEEKEEEQV